MPFDLKTSISPSVDFNGHSIDLGAQWIHGETDNAAFDLASASGAAEDPTASTLEDIGEDFVDDDGNVWEDEEVDPLWEIGEELQVGRNWGNCWPNGCSF